MISLLFMLQAKARRGTPVSSMIWRPAYSASAPFSSLGLYGHIEVLDRPRLEKRVCECYGVVSRAFDRLLPDLRAI